MDEDFSAGKMLSLARSKENINQTLVRSELRRLIKNAANCGFTEVSVKKEEIPKLSWYDSYNNLREACKTELMNEFRSLGFSILLTDEIKVSWWHVISK